MVDWMDILVEIKLLLWLLKIITSHSCSKMKEVCTKLQSMSDGERTEAKHMVVSAIIFYQKSHGKILAWTSFLVYREHSMDIILYLWWLIGFQRWKTLFLARRLVALFM